jgi:hypothetical protein
MALKPETGPGTWMVPGHAVDENLKEIAWKTKPPCQELGS